MGFVSEISWPEMESKAEIDYWKVKQTLHFFKRVAILRDEHYPNRSVCLALCIYFFLISQFLENDMFSSEIDPSI